MSQVVSSRMFSVQKALVAAVLTVAAAPFAVSGELPAWLLRSAAAVTTPAPAGGQAAVVGAAVVGQADAVARAGKSDRAAVAPTAVASRTFSIKPSGIDGVSVLVRIVSHKPAPNKPATRLEPRQNAAWPRAACEPMVSPLTEVAKQLPPGRCIT